MIIWFDTQAINTITTATNARTAIQTLNTIIDTLLAAAATAALTANMKEYGYDDGQTKTRVEYKDVSAIAAQIKDLQALQQVYLQMPGMNNRVIRLIDRSNFVNYNFNV